MHKVQRVDWIGKWIQQCDPGLFSRPHLVTPLAWSYKGWQILSSHFIWQVWRGFWTRHPIKRIEWSNHLIKWYKSIFVKIEFFAPSSNSWVFYSGIYFWPSQILKQRICCFYEVICLEYWWILHPSLFDLREANRNRVI